MKVTSAAVAALLLLAAAPLAAGEVEKEVPFVLDQWIDLAASDGPVSLHRVRLTRLGAGAKEPRCW